VLELNNHPRATEQPHRTTAAGATEQPHRRRFRYQAPTTAVEHRDGARVGLLGDEQVWSGVLLSLLAGVATSLGALALPCLPPGGPPAWVMAIALSLASGVMFAISGDILWQCHTDGRAWGHSGTLFLASFALFAAVCACGDWLERYIHRDRCVVENHLPSCSWATRQQQPSEHSSVSKEGRLVKCEDSEASRSARLAALLFASLTLHNIPEGFAVAASAMSSNHLRFTVGIAVALHNIPEGLVLAVTTYNATKSRLQATLVPVVAGFAEPLGALMSLRLMQTFITEQTIHDVLVMVAGVMCYLALGELLPAAAKMDGWRSACSGCLLGAAVMVATHEMLHQVGADF